MEPPSTTGRIDVHSHLLPGVDDGCGSVEESVACARMMVSAGYTHSFCTPHVWPNFPEQTVTSVPRWVAGLQARLDADNVPLTLLPGGELNLWPNLVQALTPDRLLTYGMAGRYCLMDLWADRLPPSFEPSVRWLQSKGLTVVLAHPERMRAVQDEPSLADRFDEMGLLLQGNLQCLNDPPGSATRTVGERFLREGRYFMLGSDLHKLDSLGHRLAGLRNAIDWMGDEVVDRLTIHNPRKLLPS